MSTLQRVEAPFSDEQIRSLNDYQTSGLGHPFTCGNREHGGDDLLVATQAGWICPTCPYTQAYAWAFMADDSWRAALEAQQALLHGGCP